VLFFFRELPRLRKAAAPMLAKLNPNAAEPMVYPLTKKENSSG